MLGENIATLVDHNGLLPAHSSLGCYPLFYVNSHNDALCADCANEHEDYDETIVACNVNYEDSSLYCDICSKRIESAYAENEFDDDDLDDYTDLEERLESILVRT